MAIDKGTTERPHSWMPPGFRHASVWHRAVAVAGYVLIAVMALITLGKPFTTLFFLASALGFVALVTNYRGTNKRLVARFAGKYPHIGSFLATGLLLLVGGWSWVGGASALSKAPAAQQSGAAIPAAVAPSSSVLPAPTPQGISEERKAEAVNLLGAAVSQRQQGNLGIALELGRQAAATWPQYADAKSFLTDVAPQATVQAQQAIAQATAAQRQTFAQATVQAQQAIAQATAQAQAAAAAARAEAEARQPRVSAVEGPTFSTQARVGGVGFLRVVLKNVGGSAPDEIRFQIGNKLFDGFILQSASPAFQDDSQFFGDRYLKWAGLPAGQQREYRLNLVGKTAGEYPFTLSIYAGNTPIGSYSGRSIVLP